MSRNKKIKDMQGLERIDRPENLVLEDVPPNIKEGEIITISLKESTDLQTKGANSWEDGWGIYYFDQDWNLGEGKFRWPGWDETRHNRNYIKWKFNKARPDDPNQVRHTWVEFYIAEFTNLNNSHWAIPGYLIDLLIDDERVNTLRVRAKTSLALRRQTTDDRPLLSSVVRCLWSANIQTCLRLDP